MGQAIENLIQYSTSGVAPFLQRGAVAALEQGERLVEENIARASRARDVLCEALLSTKPHRHREAGRCLLCLLHRRRRRRHHGDGQGHRRSGGRRAGAGHRLRSQAGRGSSAPASCAGWTRSRRRRLVWPHTSPCCDVSRCSALSACCNVPVKDANDRSGLMTARPLGLGCLHIHMEPDSHEAGREARCCRQSGSSSSLRRHCSSLRTRREISTPSWRDSSTGPASCRPDNWSSSRALTAFARSSTCAAQIPRPRGIAAS